jgi:GntR family transcriptional repressor for pyruvate dehydrogenase complex
MMHSSRIPPASRSDEIAATLRDEILRGQYRAGERLPSERDLATRFRSARGPVREALKKLEQLGIADIQPGGARVVAIEESSLAVLGPLLDLNELPDPHLVDQVLQLVGVLIGVAARTALKKATDEQIERAKQIAEDMLSTSGDPSRRHDALRELATFFIDVADHLILRLMMNDLRTTFWARMRVAGIHLDMDRAGFREIVFELRDALDRKDDEAAVTAMQNLNRFFRDCARKALQQRSLLTQQKVPA